jgi:small subunit ribosomal protein S9
MADTQQQYYEGIGRRKEATARARIYVGGSGSVKVNDKDLNVYFGRDVDRLAVNAPLALIGASSTYNVSIHVSGGGTTGQAIAARMAIARAIEISNAELRGTLKDAGFLSRDSRSKERKKPGLKRARKGPTYTKR